MKRMLIIEDDRKLQELLRSALVENYQVSSAYTLAAAYQYLEKDQFELVIVDLGLPDGDGLEIIEYLHDTNFSTKILALTTRGTVAERVTGLEKGADEYLAKPFSLAELKLKIQKWSAAEKRQEQSVVAVGTGQFYPETGVLKFNDLEIGLRRREAEILHCLVRYRNQVVTREMIIDDVWAGEDIYPAPTTLDVYIRRLRVLLRAQSKMIRTVRGFGYKFTDSGVAHT